MDIKKMKKRNEELREQIDEDRKERGLEGVPIPDKFVDENTTYFMIGECHPLERFITQYLSICDKSDEIVPLTEQQADYVRSFTKYAELTRMSVWSQFRAYGMGAMMGIGLMSEDTETVRRIKDNPTTYVRRLYMAVRMMRQCTNGIEYKTYKPTAITDEEMTEKVAEYKTHYDEIKWAL